MADQNFNVNCGFFNAVSNDRLYNAEDMNRPLKRLITNGVYATSAGTTSTDLQVVTANTGMQIICKKGEGIFADKWFENPNDISITVPANTELLPRRDSVIVQVDTRLSGRIGRIVYRTGTPASSPVPPAIDTVDGVREYRIANIYVAVSASYIGQDAIVDLRGSSECPWITSLIQQVDTSTLYDQWNAAYQGYYNSETLRLTNYFDSEIERIREFMQTVTEELEVSMDMLMLQSSYASSGQISQVPINIAGYDRITDILMVFINGLRAVEGSRYTISTDNTYITLTPAITGEQKIDFVVLKSVVAADDAEAIELLTQLSNTVSTLNTKVDSLTSDSGWINFTLEGGATAYTDAVKPAVRKYGNRTNIRGAIKGVTAAGTVICTLPAAYKPAIDHVFTTSAVSSSNAVTATVTMQVLASTGQIKLLAKNGTIGTTDMISIATNFIVG